MICNNCNTQNPDGSKFCSECGSALTSSTEPKNRDKGNISVRKSYKALRVFNWLFSILLLGGVALFLFSAKEVSPLVVGMLVFLVLILANYVGTAVALNPGVSVIMGIPILLSASSKTALNALLVGNIILCLFGLVAIVASLTTSQYGASISGFLYLFLSLGNVRAIWEIKKA